MVPPLSKLVMFENVIAIMENWFSPLVSDSEISFPGYNLIRVVRPSRGGSVAAYVKLFWSILSSLTFTCGGTQALAMKLCHPDFTWMCVVVYHPPPATLEDLMSFLSESATHLRNVVAGDFNMDFLRLSSNTRRFFSFLRQYHCEQRLRPPHI